MSRPAPSILYPSELSVVQCGSQMSLLSLLSTRDRSFYRRIALCPPGPEYVSALEALDVRTFVAGSHPHNWRFAPTRPAGTLRDLVAATRATTKIVRQENVRLIHASSLVAGLTAVFAQMMNPALRIVLHERGLVYRAHTLPLFRWVCRRVDRVIVTTDIGRKQLIAFGVAANRIAVIPNGTDFHLRPALTSREQMRESLGIPPQARVVGMVANMVRVKRHELFVEAIARLLRDEDVYGVIAGGVLPILAGNAIEHEVRARVNALGIADRVIFTGMRNDMPDLIRAMDVLVCTSSHETFGRVLIEAMAVGTPVVATAAGAISDVVSDERTGLLAADDADAIATAIKRILSDRSLVSSLTSSAREEVRLRFDAAAVTRSIEAVYREVLSK